MRVKLTGMAVDGDEVYAEITLGEWVFVVIMRNNGLAVAWALGFPGVTKSCGPLATGVALGIPLAVERATRAACEFVDDGNNGKTNGRKPKRKAKKGKAKP